MQTLRLRLAGSVAAAGRLPHLSSAGLRSQNASNLNRPCSLNVDLKSEVHNPSLRRTRYSKVAPVTVAAP